MSKGPKFLKGVDQKILEDPKVARYLTILAKIVDAGGRVVDIAFSKPIMFGKRIGFIMANAKVKDSEGDPIPAGAFLRGDSAAILVILKAKDGDEYAVVTEQFRLPVGMTMMEIPAGTFEDSGSMAGLAATELDEELGLKIEKDQLVRLGPEEGVAVSPGGCDERIHLFLYKQEMMEREILEMQGRLTGDRVHGEKITVRIVPVADFIHSVKIDAKSLAAFAFYQRKEFGLDD